MKNFKFRASARILDSIGKDLIKDDVAAIIELIKNSYDADAKKVLIKFFYENDGLKISIKDNGNGMSVDTFENKWLVPGTKNKVLNPYSPGKRRVLGAKGLGRYAVSILGSKMKLISVSNKEKIIVDIDWIDLSKVEYLDEISLNTNIEKTAEDNYTEIIIENLYDKDLWMESGFSSNKLKNLVHNLKLIMAPQEVNDDFKILGDFRAISKEYNTIINIEPYDLLHYYHYQLKGHIDVKNKKFDVTFVNNISGENITEKVDNTHSVFTELKKLKFQDSFKFDFRVIERDPLNIGKFINNSLSNNNGNPFTRAEAARLLDSIAGVKIYKENFRIRPYGDIEDDWLGLNKERFQNPTEKISSNQINGTIIFDNTNLQYSLSEKSARDGFIEDDNFYNFKYSIKQLINFLAIEKLIIKKNIKKNDTRKTIEEKIDFVSDYNNLKENIGTQLTTLSISKEEIQKINYIIDEKAKETKQVIEEMKREVAMYQQQVTLGKLISVLMHEGRKHISALRETPDILQKRIKQFLKNPSDEIHESINFNMAAISTHSLMINNLFNKIDPLARKRNPNKKVFSLEKAFRTAKKSFETPLLENNITIEENFEISEIFGWEIDFITAFTNLIDNSIYWMNTKEMKRIKISSQLDNNKVLIKYTDSGEGIPVKYLENDSIFEPGISYKIDGTGLGLAIAGEALKRNEFTLKAIEYTEGAYFTIEGCEENNGTN